MDNEEYFSALTFVQLGQLLETRLRFKELMLSRFGKSYDFYVPFIVMNTEKEIIEAILKYFEIEDYYFEDLKENFYLLRIP